MYINKTTKYMCIYINEWRCSVVRFCLLILFLTWEPRQSCSGCDEEDGSSTRSMNVKLIGSCSCIKKGRIP